MFGVGTFEAVDIACTPPLERDSSNICLDPTLWSYGKVGALSFEPHVVGKFLSCIFFNFFFLRQGHTLVQTDV